MKKIILKNCDVKEFCSLIKRSASLDNMIFINLRGSEFESTAHNQNKSALKSISANLEEYCDEFVNECNDITSKIFFSNASKIVSVLSLIGTEGVTITFYIEESGFAKKLVVENNEMNMTIPAGDHQIHQFLEIPDHARVKVLEDKTLLKYSVNINDNEFKLMTQLFGLNKESLRVCFSITNDGCVKVSEIDGTDDNVREKVNEMIDGVYIHEFDTFEKLYSKNVSYDRFDKTDESGDYIKCFNKSYFAWIDANKDYDIEFHEDKIKFMYTDEKGTKTYVILTPVIFV